MAGKEVAKGMRHRVEQLPSVETEDSTGSGFSVDALLRVITMIVGALIGWELGLLLSNVVPVDLIPFSKRYYQFILMLAFALLGFAVGPYVTVKPYRALRHQLRQLPARALIMGIIGSLIGLLIAALLALPLSLLPGAFGQLLPFVFALILASIGATTMVIREKDIAAILGLFAAREASKRSVVLLDTSVIIDGRIVDICQSGFLSGTLLVPRFVLEELQRIADSGEALRRNRGRRGLDILNKMQKDQRIPMEICDMDAPEIREVDGKLVKLAQQLDCPVFTNDYNLNRVAELQGVRVLNINELANAVKAVVLPGESLQVDIIQEGKETGQGVGYLDDGTMVVVEDGRRWMHTSVDIAVTRVLQTVAGRMIFGQIEEEKR
jgi:uncharacterized protein YacL